MPSQRKLTDNQIHLLKLIYKFRFVTVDLLSEYRNQGNSAIHDSLGRLLYRELIARKYSKVDKIDRRPARYYLTSTGMKELKSHIEVNPRVAHSFYKNKSLSDDFIQHCLNIFKAYNHLRTHYADRFMILANSEMADYDQFKPTNQDLYLRDDNANQYFLNIYENTQRFVIEKHIKQHIERSEDINWPGGYPNLLIACSSPRTMQKLMRRYETHLEDFDMYFTTTKELLEGDSKEIWIDPVDSEKLVSL